MADEKKKRVVAEKPLESMQEGSAVLLPVDQWYDFHECGYHLGNVGLD